MRRAAGSPPPFEASLKRAAAALRDAGVEFLLGGSMASCARGGPETRNDLDIIVRPADAEAALDALTACGMRPERPPEEWLLKAWDGDVPIDVIFSLKGLEDIEEVLRRGKELDVLGVRMRVIALEDMLAAKLLSLSEHELDYSGPMSVARALREQIDWRTLSARTAHSPYARVFFRLLDELGILDRDRAAHEGAEVRVITPSGARAG
jgi:predicted nucleotidyltransferase